MPTFSDALLAPAAATAWKGRQAPGCPALCQLHFGASAALLGTVGQNPGKAADTQALLDETRSLVAEDEAVREARAIARVRCVQQNGFAAALLPAGQVAWVVACTALERGYSGLQAYFSQYVLQPLRAGRWIAAVWGTLAFVCTLITTTGGVLLVLPALVAMSACRNMAFSTPVGV